MIDADPPRTPLPFDHLRVPFCFVPHGTTLPEDWAATYPGWVTFPATLRLRLGGPPPLRVEDAWPSPVETAAASAHADAAQSHPSGARPVTPRMAGRPNLPVHHAPPRIPYTGPEIVLAAFGGSTASATGRAALIRSAQATLDTLARQAAARATRTQVNVSTVPPRWDAPSSKSATVILQSIDYYTSNITSSTARALDMNRYQRREAIHRLKRGVDLGPNDNVIIHIPSGDAYFNNEPIGNLRDEY